MKLSIIIPTHNREENLVATAAKLLAADSTDFEIVLALNSDRDHEQELPVPLKTDKRVKILSNPPKPLSMQDNWERAINSAEGDWLSIIGDDDFIFIELIDFLKIIEQQSENIEAVSWNKILFNWQDTRPIIGVNSRAKRSRDLTCISLDTDFKRVSTDSMLGEALRWNSSRRTPPSGGSIYHGALKKNLVKRLYKKYNRHFTDPIVDFDIGYRVLLEVENIFWSMRPFSIMGASRKSNSFGVNNNFAQAERADSFWKLNNFTSKKSDEFDETCGLVATVYNFQKRFCEANSIPWALSYEKILEKIQLDCLSEFSEQGCARKAHLYNLELARLFPFAHKSSDLNLSWIPPAAQDFQGLSGKELVVDAAQFETIYEFAQFCRRFLCDPQFIGRSVSFRQV